MSNPDERQILETLERLSQVEPAPEATARAIERVRGTLTTGVPIKGPHHPWRISMHNRYAKAVLGLAAAAAVAIALFASWPGTRNGTATAAEVMRQGIAAVAELRSVYIKVSMRTPPGDNFGTVSPDFDFTPIEMWKEFGNPPKWRMEEPGRVIVVDGQSNVQLIKPGPGNPRGIASKQSAKIDRGRQLPSSLLDVDQVLESELKLAQEKGWSSQLTQERDADGADKLVVTIQGSPRPRTDAELKSPGASPEWLKMGGIGDSENRRVYRFDAQSKRLEDVKVYTHANAGDVLLLEVTGIVYNPVIPPATFTLTLPEDVIWFAEPSVVPNNDSYAKMSPNEAAQAFFQACADENWDEALKYWAMSAFPEGAKQYLGGLKIISIGEPFRSPGRYAGWYVPYEIQLKSGESKKWNLALRNDNKAKRWQVDGGL